MAVIFPFFRWPGQSTLSYVHCMYKRLIGNLQYYRRERWQSLFMLMNSIPAIFGLSPKESPRTKNLSEEVQLIFNRKYLTNNNSITDQGFIISFQRKHFNMGIRIPKPNSNHIPMWTVIVSTGCNSGQDNCFGGFLERTRRNRDLHSNLSANLYLLTYFDQKNLGNQ